LNQRGWRNKRCRTRKGHERGGKAFTNTSLQLLLTHVLYVGNIKHKGHVHPGEHQGIVAKDIWQQVQDRLAARSQSSLMRNRSGSLLKGILHCLACACRMTPTHAITNGGKRYRYYVCSASLRVGHHCCPAPSLAAPLVEQVVLEQVKVLTQDCASVQELLDQAWATLTPLDQARLLRLLIQRVDYDGHAGKLALLLHPRGVERLAQEFPGEPA
jgi:site-specific DNA recombinase